MNFFDTIPNKNFFDDIPAQAGANVPVFGKDDPRDNEVTAAAYNFASAVPFAQKAAAAVSAPVKSMMSGGGLEGVAPAYNELRDRQKQIDQIYDRDRNTAANVGAISGAVLNPANWTLGKAGLLANAGLQAGSDTDFSKEGAGQEFAGKAATNLALGKLLQKGVGAVTGSESLQKAGKYIGDKLSADKLANATVIADKLKNIGGDNSPLLFTAGKEAVDTIVPIAKSSKIADKVGEAADNVSSLIGNQGKSTIDKVDRFGSIGKNVADQYEAGKTIEIAKKGFNQFLASDTPGAQYVAQAASQLKSAKPNSGEVIQRALENAKAVSKEEGDRVGQELTDKFGPIFKEADSGYKMLSDVRRQTVPFRQAVKVGAGKAEQQQANKELQNQAVRAGIGIVKGATAPVRAITGLGYRALTGEPSKAAQGKIIDLLANKSTPEASDIINRSRRGTFDTLLQTNNKNATPIEQYLPYLAMHLRRKQ